MTRTRVSSKYQVVIPKEVRARAGVKPGQEFQVITKGAIISLVPEKSILSLQGFVRGISIEGHREKKDRM